MSHQLDAEHRFCTFVVGDHDYGIDILAVREINRDLSITRTLGAPPFVRGLLNLRGQIVTVLETAVILGEPRARVTNESRLVVFKSNAELEARGVMHVQTSDDLVGIWVDRVGDVVNVLGYDIKSTPASMKLDQNSAIVAGVVHREDHLIRVLQPDLLLRLEGAVG